MVRGVCVLCGVVVVGIVDIVVVDVVVRVVVGLVSVVGTHSRRRGSVAHCIGQEGIGSGAQLFLTINTVPPNVVGSKCSGVTRRKQRAAVEDKLAT